MKLTEKLSNKLYKWVVLYPRFRKLVNWAYSDLMKMPQYHIDLTPAQIGKYVILVDDPSDTEKVAAFFDDPQEVAFHREYRTFTGQLLGEKVSVTSIGIGGPPSAIGVHELATIGASTFLYLGNCYSPIDPAEVGQFIIPIGCVRDEGTGLQYAPLAFPAIGNLYITENIRNACINHHSKYHIGFVRSTDAYSKIKCDTVQNFPNILASDMNTSAIFIVASVLNKQAGSLLFLSEKIQPLQKNHILIGIESLKNSLLHNKR